MRSIDQALTHGPGLRTRCLKEALATRPEVLEADAQIAAARRGIQYARRSLLPGLSLSLGYYNVRNSTGTARIDEPEAGVGISLPLFDGGLARAREQQARADIATATTNKRQAIDQVTLDVQQAYLNLVQARDQVAVANQALAQARTGFQLARVRYNAGVARAGISPQLEVSDAQAALTQAESNQVNAIYDYNQSRAQLDRAIGRFFLRPERARVSRVRPPMCWALSAKIMESKQAMWMLSDLGSRSLRMSAREPGNWRRNRSAASGKLLPHRALCRTGTCPP